MVALEHVLLFIKVTRLGRGKAQSKYHPTTFTDFCFCHFDSSRPSLALSYLTLPFPPALAPTLALACPLVWLCFASRVGVHGGGCRRHSVLDSRSHSQRGRSVFYLSVYLSICGLVPGLGWAGMGWYCGASRLSVLTLRVSCESVRQRERLVGLQSSQGQGSGPVLGSGPGPEPGPAGRAS